MLKGLPLVALKIISYTDLLYIRDAGASCGANFTSPPSDETSADEGVAIVEGYEYGESVTDSNPPTGWYNKFHGEICDVTAWLNILTFLPAQTTSNILNCEGTLGSAVYHTKLPR
jgi:hypothetical protein